VVNDASKRYTETGLVLDSAGEDHTSGSPQNLN